jgi:hypothetical protein
VGSTDREERQRLLADLLLELINETGARVALIGGQATNFWARPRYTDDFDFTVAADPAAIDLLVRGLVERGFEVVREQAGGSPSGPDFVRLERPNKLDAVDLIVAKTEYQDLVVQRAVGADGTAIPIATVEDLIVLKLIANRSKDHEDINRLIESRPGIDWPYVRQWAGIWGVEDKIDGVIARASDEADAP